jgi:class 3 adenylate cyclase/tetratricopeptide (TPR) repeat protein
MASLWLPYIPYHVAQDLLAHPTVDPVGREQRSLAAVLFADISGFTALSEALGSIGRSGSEQLTDILNGYFGVMIDLIQSYGGIIGKFGGDSMTVLFPCAEQEHPAVARRAAHCAAHCAWEMQAQMSRYASLTTPAGVFSLTMKAGLAWGPVFCTIVGQPGVRLEYIIAGSVLDRAAEAQALARAGEVIVQSDLLPASDSETTAVSQGFCRLVRLAHRVEPAPLQPLGELEPETIQTIAAFLPPSIAERLRDGQASFVNEHRKVAVLFAGFSGLDYDGDPRVGAKLQTYLSEVIRIVQRYDGYLNKVDMGDKGSKIVILFGAPIAHENDTERALRCALDLRALPGVATRIGINTGFVYSGLVGSEQRREYTVMGDAVNLAARLMQTAGVGQILASDTAQRESRGRFAWEAAQSISIKGKTGPVGLHVLTGLSRTGAARLTEIDYPLPMVGRQAEMAVLRDRMERALQGQGQIIGLTAEAGMGKSRLAAEVIRLAAESGLTGYGGECLSHGAATSYLVWQNLLRGFFGLDPAWPLEQQGQHLEAELAAVDPGFIQRLPLLRLPLGLPIPDNELTHSLDAKIRKDSLEALLVACIRQRAPETPLLLVLEDCHWIDPLSADLLEAVGRNIADLPVFILVIYRPPESEQAVLRITRFGHFAEIPLAEFTPEEARQLIDLKLARLFGEASRAPDELIERILERAQGNPFYLDEMINLVRDRQIDLADSRALANLDLPGSLHSLIISRIDQLPENTKTTLKVASVIGRTFKANWLWGVYPPLGAPEQVKEQLSQLSRLDITQLDKPEPELEFIFKHIITRQVAYESLSVATRVMLHERTGQFIELAYREQVDRYLDLLAHHYGLSHHTAKQREYFRKAGQAACEAFANEAAIQYYQRLLPLLPQAGQGEILLELGHIWQLTGQWREAEEAFQQVLAIADKIGAAQQVAESQCRLGVLSRLRGAFSDALAWLERAGIGFEALGSQQGIGEVAKETGIVYWSQGNYPEALACFEKCQQIAIALNDQRNLYRAIGNMGLIYEMQGNNARALACHEQGFQIATRLGDRLGSSVAVGNMGNVYLEQGYYSRALTCYLQNLHIALELGYRLGVSIAIGNVGNVYWWQGHYEEALACQAMNLQISLELGDWLGIGRAIWNVASTLIERGHYERANRLLDQAIAIARALDTPDELSEFLATKADALIHLGDYAIAQPVNAEALKIAAEIDYRVVAFKAQVTAARLQALLSQIPIPEAVSVLERLLSDAQNETEQAEVQHEIWRLDSQQETHCQQAASLYRTLYSRTPNVLYRRRYQRLTGQRLPDPPALPPLPEVVTRQRPDLDKLLAQVEARLPEASQA